MSSRSDWFVMATAVASAPVHVTTATVDRLSGSGSAAIAIAVGITAVAGNHKNFGEPWAPHFCAAHERIAPDGPTLGRPEKGGAAGRQRLRRTACAPTKQIRCCRQKFQFPRLNHLHIAVPPARSATAGLSHQQFVGCRFNGSLPPHSRLRGAAAAQAHAPALDARPGMPRDTLYAGDAAIFTSALRRGDTPRVFEDGRQRRAFVHVRDIATATVTNCENSVTGVEAFNVGSARRAPWAKCPSLPPVAA